MRHDESSAGSHVIVLASHDARRARRQIAPGEQCGQILLFTGVSYGAYIAPRVQTPKRTSAGKGSRKRRSS